MNQDCWVIIPAFNEANQIREVILKVKKYCKNIVVVDDGSKDNTVKTTKETGAVVLEHLVNLGKGGALKTGCDYAYIKGAKKMILMDADGQHDPGEIPVFLRGLEKYEVVFGSRGFNKKMPLVFKLGNSFLSWFTSIFFGVKLNDTQSGYRAFTREAYRKIRWKVCDYSVENEMIANVGKKRLKYKQIPIKTIYGDKYKGTTVLDGIKIMFNMLFWRLR